MPFNKETNSANNVLCIKFMNVLCIKIYIIHHSWKTHKIYGLSSFFNGISTFMGYLMPRTSLQKSSNDTIQPIAEKNKRVHGFSSGISSK